MSRVVILDCESSGLDHRVHEAWEWGLIVREPGQPDVEHLWRVQADLTKAEPAAMIANRYYERTRDMLDSWSEGFAYDLAGWATPGGRPWSDPAVVARELARLVDRAVVVGANPTFDRDMLRPFLHRHGQAHTAHYRPVCVTVAGWGYLCGQGKGEGLSWPLSSNEVSRALGVDPAGFARHSALGDCKWAMSQYEIITGADHG